MTLEKKLKYEKNALRNSHIYFQNTFYFYDTNVTCHAEGGSMLLLL